MKRIISLFILFSVVTVSCKKDFLNGTKPEDKISDADVWQSPALANQVINGCYDNLPAGHTWFMMMSATDEGMFQYNDLGTPYTMATVSPQNLGSFSNSVWAWGEEDWNWDWVYSNIRNITIALQHLPTVPFATPDDKNIALADAHFIRGFSYFLLMQQYGGVILYKDPVQFGSNYKVPRNTFEETVNFIVADFDAAISLYKDADIATIKTRGDKGIAMAMKAKALLYAASDLHNNQKNSSIAAGSHPELIGYTSGDPTARWQAARDAAKAVIDLGKYSLHNGNSDLQRNFEEVFLTRSDEDIFIRYADQKVDYYYALNRTPLWQNSPGYGGSGANAVLGDLVDAFEMKDGTKFSWGSPAEAANPYVNRDPRLAASVLYEGAQWYPRAATNGLMRMGTWADGTTGPDAQFTNYWMRKYIDVQKGKVPDYADLTACPPWVRMRYAEVLLDYAEACIELGQDAEARTYINMVRARVGMPPVTESGDALKQRYRNERRVELAFEEQRFFDVRRWMIGPQSAISGNGVQIAYPVQGSFANPTYKSVMVDVGRKWDNKEYFLPISVNEMNKNTALIQNPGY